MNDFIEVYDGALSDDYCDALIQKYENSAEDRIEKSAKKYGVGDLGAQIKDSYDLGMHAYPEWQDDFKQVREITTQHLAKYVKKYSHFIHALLGRKMTDNVTGVEITLTDELIATMPDEVVATLIHMHHQHAEMNVQKYLKGKGGFHKWHSEIAANDPRGNNLHRTLFTIFYLNDIEEGGETDFFYFDRSVQPKKGRMVISPAGFTHTHKGNIPVSDDKYILASWVSFIPFQQMQQQQRNRG